MKAHEKLLSQNKAWVQEKLKVDDQFFQKLKDTQKPDFLWIGCADSRVPVNQITGTEAGEVFVHRNIANMVIHTDMSMLSVLQYAVDVLQVKHVVVCGHYGCGGVRAALSNSQLGLIDNWLRNIKDVYRLHEEELDVIEDAGVKENTLIELNVMEQLYNLAKTSTIQAAWKNRKMPTLHGWVYDLADGILKEVGNISADTDLAKIYSFDL